MRKALFGLPAIAVALAFSAPPAQAGSPHFINNAWVVDISGNTITVSGKEAGLGDESQIHVELTGVAECINRGGHHPKAANKTGIAAAGDFPVQNGKADFTLSASAVFQPNCSPPMSVVFKNIVVRDAANNLTYRIS